MTESILEEAQRLTHGDRNVDYGHPHDDYSRTAALWSVLLGDKLSVPITAHEAALCMCAVKLSREVHRPKRDNMTDLAGYAWVAFKCHERETEVLNRHRTSAELPEIPQVYSQPKPNELSALLRLVDPRSPKCPICHFREDVTPSAEIPGAWKCSTGHVVFHFNADGKPV